MGIPFFGYDVHDTHEELEYAKMQNHFRQFSFAANAQNQFYVDQIKLTQPNQLAPGLAEPTAGHHKPWFQNPLMHGSGESYINYDTSKWTGESGVRVEK